MEVKTVKRGYEDQFLDIYIDNVLYKTVKSKYYLRRLSRIAKDKSFKENFEKLEMKKCLDLSLYLLSKRGYLKKNFIQKMEEKLFPRQVIEKVYQEHLEKYFNEEEDLTRQVSSHIEMGKGRKWLINKYMPLISIEKAKFMDLLDSLLLESCSVTKIHSMITSRSLLEVKGKEKTIAFFLRRGFSYTEILQAIKQCES